MAEGDLSGVRARLASERDIDPKELAKDLMRVGKLTRYQAANTLQGRAKGLVFGDYLVLDKLGAGGMGQVFKAQHRRMKRVVALKVLPPELTTSKKTVQRFYQEVEMAAKLIHPNIVTAFDAGEERGLHYLVMEYVDGQDLSSFLRAKGALPVEQTVNVILQAARGLAYAHSKGVIHRDIKPSNLLVSRAGDVKILDMGLARVSQTHEDTPADREGLTEDGQLMGTPDYMAPEQAADTRQADQRSDIYSLGCTLYRLLTGALPFPADTSVQKILAHRELPIPSLRAVRPETPEALDHIYQQMLAKNPAQRPASIDVVVQALEALSVDDDDERSSISLGEEVQTGEEGYSSFLGLGSTIRPNDPAAPGWKEPSASGDSFSLTGGGQSKKSLMIIVAAASVAVLVIGIAVWALVGGKSDADQVASNDAAPTDVAPLTPEPENKVDAPTTAPASTKSDEARPLKPAESPPENSPPAESKKTKKPKTPPVTTSTSPTTTPAAASSPPGTTRVDLLHMIDTVRNSVVGEWKMDAGALISPDEGPGNPRLQIPYVAPDEYELAMSVERLSAGKGHLTVGLVFESSYVGFTLDIGKKECGLDQIDGKGFAKNETHRTGLQGLAGSEPIPLVLRVQSGRIEVIVSGETVVDWQGKASVCAIPPPFQKGIDRTQLFLGAHNSAPLRFTKIELTRFDDTPQPTTTDSALAKPGPRIDLLRLTEAKRDAIEGQWTTDGLALVAPAQPSKSPSPVFQFPYTPPAEYELHANVVPADTSGNFTIGLIVGTSRVGFLVEHGQKVSGLDTIDRKGYSGNPTTKSNLPGLGRGEPIAVLCRVKPSGVVVTLDGKTVVDWTGNPSQLRSTRGGPDRTKLSLQTNGPGLRITKFDVIPTGGPPEAVPSASALAAVATKVKEYVGDLPPNATAIQKAERATNVRQQASLADDVVLRYALLTEALKLTAATDELELVSTIIEDLARCYQIDADELLNNTLNDIANRPRQPKERTQFLLTLLDAIDSEATAERYDRASLLISMATTLVAKSTDNELKKEVQYREQEIAEGQKRFAAAEEARKTLADKPTDAEANLAVGRYLAIARGDWTAALDYLVKGSDLAVQAAAQLDARFGTDASRAGDVGIAWLDAAEKASGPDKPIYLERARAYLARGAANLSAANLTKTQNRFKKVETDARRATGMAFVKRHSPRAVAFGGHWYLYFPDGVNWQRARQRCQDLGGDLVSLETPAEAQFVYAYTVAQFGSPDVFTFWLGATEEGHDGTFTWANGSPLQFTDWGKDKGSGNISGEAVAAQRLNSGSPRFNWFAATSQRNAYPFVCEWDR